MDLNDKFMLQQVENNSVVWHVEALLETIRRSERNDEIPKQQFRFGGSLPRSSDVDRVPSLRAGVGRNIPRPDSYMKRLPPSRRIEPRILEIKCEALRFVLGGANGSRLVGFVVVDD